MEIDNFAEVRKHLEFLDTKLDRYIVHILRRPKDIPSQMKNELGANECQRLIRTYYIDSLEYFDRKMPAIKELCKANLARAYINVQPKDNFECLMNLGKKIFDTLQCKNFSVKPEHLVRQAYSEWHKTRKKQWILDIDDDCCIEWFEVEDEHGKKCICSKTWNVDSVISLVKKQLVAIGKSEDEVYSLKTKNGYHVICSPFNLIEAQKLCSFLFEGRHKMLNENGDLVERTGWLHKDGVTLLYMDL